MVEERGFVVDNGMGRGKMLEASGRVQTEPGHGSGVGGQGLVDQERSCGLLWGIHQRRLLGLGFKSIDHLY